MVVYGCSGVRITGNEIPRCCFETIVCVVVEVGDCRGED